MSILRDVSTVAFWEIRSKAGILDRKVLLPAIILLIFLILVSHFATQSGLHLNDGIYSVGVRDPAIGQLFAGDPRFNIELISDPALMVNNANYDVIITDKKVFASDTKRGHAAVSTLSKVYDRYQNNVYSEEPELFLAYPLWIDIQYVASPVDFAATQSGQAVSSQPSSRVVEPQGPVEQVTPPDTKINGNINTIRKSLTNFAKSDSPLNRYNSILGTGTTELNYKTPSQFSPPLPFDTIILIFIFIFPLYFISQFFMMSIMDERIGRRGEPLLSTPLSASAIIIGKAVPYFALMVLCTICITFILNAPVSVMFPLIPVMVFFLSIALLIGMTSRSFKELSFLSIFFSTIATSYLFFPSIFAHVHVVSMVSPITLVVLTLEKSGYNLNDYLFSTALFYLAAFVILVLCIKNFREEQLFSQKKIFSKIIDFLKALVSEKHPFLSLAVITVLFIPLVFMMQLFVLVLFFNLPMPLSLILILIAAAFIEELMKSLGILAFIQKRETRLDLFSLIIASVAVAAGFLAGEKLLLFITLSQITDSVFGSILFTSLGSLIYPFLLHFVCTLIVAILARKNKSLGYSAGIAAATVIHCSYNAIMIRGWLT